MVAGNKKTPLQLATSLMAPVGLEPTTHGSEDRCAIQLR